MAGGGAKTDFSLYGIGFLNAACSLPMGNLIVLGQGVEIQTKDERFRSECRILFGKLRRHKEDARRSTEEGVGVGDRLLHLYTGFVPKQQNVPDDFGYRVADDKRRLGRYAE